MKTENSLPCSQ